MLISEVILITQGADALNLIGRTNYGSGFHVGYN
jgi:hypothetical protein